MTTANECRLRFTYAGVVSGINIDRNDGAYTTPHTARQFVLLVDDADTEWPIRPRGPGELALIAIAGRAD